VGSSKKLSGKLLNKYKDSLTLTKLQQEVLIGTVLGDAYLRLFKKGANLTISHSESQLDYVKWKYNVFRNWVLTKPQKEIRKYYKDTSRNLISWRFSTLSHKILARYYHSFYQNGKKIIPANIESLISPLALAVWFMDDGSRKPYGRGAFLHTQSFSLNDQRKLIRTLKVKFSIEARFSSAGFYHNKNCALEGVGVVQTDKVRSEKKLATLRSGLIHKGRRYYRLYITADSFPKFRNLVLPYMLDSMKYKISL